MDFTVAIGTEEFTLPKFLSNPIPTSSVPFIRNPEVFIGGFEVMYL